MPGVLRCTLCERPITASDRSVAEPAGRAHVACLLKVDEAIRTAVTILTGDLSHRVCHVCLTGRLAVEEAIARNAVARLGMGPLVLVEPGRCAECGLRRVTTRARAAQSPPLPSSRSGDVGAALDAFHVAVPGRVCVMLAGPGVAEPVPTSPLESVAGCLLERGARRVYLPDFDGTLGTALANDSRIVLIPPTALLIRVGELPERPSLAVLDLRLGAVDETLRAMSAMLDTSGQIVAHVRLDSVIDLHGRDRTYSGILCRVAIVGVARSAVLRGWQVIGIAPAPRRGAGGHAFYLHLATDAPAAPDLDEMLARTVETLV